MACDNDADSELRCAECKRALRAQDAKNYLGPVSGDGFRRIATVCQDCFEVLP